jgi:hypothetical protein
MVVRQEGKGGFGISVSGISDVNGDGRGDVIVGAYNESPGSSPKNAGRAYIFDGSTGLLLHSLAAPDEDQEALFGWSVDGLADGNGDHLGDVIVGAYFYGSIYTSSQGRAYLFDGATGSHLSTLSPPDLEGGYFGWSVAAIADRNGDNLDEVIVGAPTADLHPDIGGGGKSYLFFSPQYPVAPPTIPELMEEVLDQVAENTEFVRDGSNCLTILSATGFEVFGCLECGIVSIDSTTDCSSQFTCETTLHNQHEYTECEWRIGNLGRR